MIRLPSGDWSMAVSQSLIHSIVQTAMRPIRSVSIATEQPSRTTTLQPGVVRHTVCVPPGTGRNVPCATRKTPASNAIATRNRDHIAAGSAHPVTITVSNAISRLARITAPCATNRSITGLRRPPIVAGRIPQTALGCHPVSPGRTPHMNNSTARCTDCHE